MPEKKNLEEQKERDLLLPAAVGKKSRKNRLFYSCLILFGLTYVLLVGAVAYGLFVSGIEKIEPKILLFALIGLIVAPALVSQLPLLKAFKAFGIEFELQEKVEENSKYISDLDNAIDDRILKILNDSIDEQSLSELGRRKMQEWKDKEENQ